MRYAPRSTEMRNMLRDAPNFLDRRTLHFSFHLPILCQCRDRLERRGSLYEHFRMDRMDRVNRSSNGDRS